MKYHSSMPSRTSEPNSPAASSSNQGHDPQTTISPATQTHLAIPASTWSEPIGISPQIAPDHLTLPTVLITYKHPLSNQPRSVKARIDRNVPLEEVIRQLTASAQLAVNQSAERFALRDAANNELVTNQNISRKVANGAASFKLVPSPSLEAVDMADRLRHHSSDEKMTKLLLFSLKDYLREPDFTHRFEQSGGATALVRLCETASAGNTLAYALSALQVLAEQDRAHGILSQTGLRRFARLLRTSALVNVLRPTTAIVRRLVSAPGGFEDVWPSFAFSNEDKQEPDSDILTVLARRISAGASADFSLAQVSLGLVNDIIKASLSSSQTDRERIIAFEDSLERAGMAKAVIRLQDAGAGELDGLVFGFQTLCGQLFTRLRELVVSSEYAPDVEKLVEMADRASSLDRKPNETADQAEEREAKKWKTLGFESENLLDDFENVGALGLKLMYRFTTLHTSEFDKFIIEELARPEAKRCPFAKASNKSLEILAEIYEWTVSETSQAPRLLNISTVYQPLMLQLPKLHSHVIRFFRLMWAASGATINDFTRVGVLVRSHVSNTLASISKFGSRRQWAELVRELETVDYVRVRDRQMQELALEDSLLNKPSVRNLRGKVYQDSLELVKTQRINALMQGSWFPHHQTSNSPSMSPSVMPSGGLRTKNSVSTPNLLAGGFVQQQRWRFYRLAPNRKHLHYLEAGVPGPVKNGVDEMPDRIEISSITEIISGNGAPDVPTPMTANGPFQRPSQTRRLSTHSNASNTTVSSTHYQHHQLHLLSTQPTPTTPFAPPRLSLMGAGQTLAILTPGTMETYSEWLDGLNLIRQDEKMITVQTKESIEIVFAMTQIGTWVKLLDLSGERVEIPSSIEVPPVPISTDFFYSEETAPVDTIATAAAEVADSS